MPGMFIYNGMFQQQIELFGFTEQLPVRQRRFTARWRHAYRAYGHGAMVGREASRHPAGRWHSALGIFNARKSAAPRILRGLPTNYIDR